MSLPVFQYVYYLLPWSPQPPGFPYLGLYAQLSAGTGSGGPYAAGRLRQGNTTLQVVVSTNYTSVQIMPATPLSATLDYYLDVKWVSSQGTPAWDAGSYATAPVMTAVATAIAGAVTGSTVSLSWTFGSAGLTPAGANLNAYTSGNSGAGSAAVLGTSGSVTLNNKAVPGSVLYIQALLPITAGTGFAAPFSMGPMISAMPLPLATPTITSLDFDGARAQVGWTPPPPPTTGGAIAYDLVVTAGGTLSVFEAGPNGGMAMLGSAPPAGTSFGAGGRVRIGALVGSPGAAIALISDVPVVEDVTLQSGGPITAKVVFPSGMPAGATAMARLLQDGQVKSSAAVNASGGTATVGTFTSGDGWTVQAQMIATVSGAAVKGPWSDPVPVLVAAPVIRSVEMTADPSAANRWIVTVEAAAAAPSGATLAFALAQGGAPVASQSVANGNIARFSLAQGSAAANTINGGIAAQATLTIVGAHGASPAAQATFIGTAPTIASVQNIGASDPTGGTQGLQVSLAQAPTSSQVPVIRLIGGGEVVATANGAASNISIVLPFSQALNPALDWVVQARLTGSGVTSDTFGGWSAPVAVLTSITSLVSADFDSGQLALAIQPPLGVSPAGGAYLFAAASGQPTKGANVTGTRGSFALSPASAAWQAGAKPSQTLPGGGRTFAPSSATVPLLLNAPALASIGFDGAILSAAWSVVNDVAGNPATGAVLRIANAGGTTASVSVGSASGEVALQIPASAQGSATVAVRATRATATAALSGAYCTPVQPIVAAPTIGTVALNSQGNSVSAALALPSGMPAGTSYRAWLMAGDGIVAGPATATISGQTANVGFSYAALGVSGLTIVARAQATVSGVALTGPRSAPVPVLATAPRIATVAVATDPADSAKWRLDGSWLPPADGASIISYWLKLADSGGAIVQQAGFGGATTGSLSFAKSGLVATSPYTLTLTATSANGSTAPAAATPFWFASPVFSAVAVGETQLSAAWTSPAGPSGLIYRLTLLDGASSAAIAAVATSATTATMDVAGLRLQPGGRYLLGLATQLGPVSFDAGSDGTYKTRPALLLQVPYGLHVATNAANGRATLSWEGVDGATGYTLHFSDGRGPVTVAGAQYNFTQALPPGSDLSIAVAANITSAGVVSTGPASAPLTIPTSAPALVSASYDGATASAAWQPVAGAVGYVATLLAANGSIAVTAPQTGATSVAFAATLAAASGPFTLVVQAVGEIGTGLPSAALPVFQTGWFVSTAKPDTAPPNIFPASTLALAAEQISIYLPALGTRVVANTTVGPFALTGRGEGGGAFPYVLTFSQNSNVWTFSAGANDPAPPIRPQLRTDYVNFLKAAQSAGAAPWGISVLQQAIARWMPQTFDELHYYSYGLNLTGGKGTGSIDLRQGLVLRVGFADYTNVWSGESNSWLNGFGGGSPTDFDVADYISGSGTWQLSMDAFVARLTASGAMTVSPPATLISATSSAGVADAADLFFPNFPNPFYRLFFPGTLQNPTSTGSVATPANFALASAPDYAALTTTSPTAGQNRPLAYFRGRAVLRLMIRVRVNDMELVVPLGTTVGNVLDRYGVRPPATGVQFTGIVLERASGPGIAVFGPSPAAPPATYSSAARHRVRLDWSTMATYGGPVDATNLPLLHGDRIAF